MGERREEVGPGYGNTDIGRMMVVVVVVVCLEILKGKHCAPSLAYIEVMLILLIHTT